MSPYLDLFLVLTTDDIARTEVMDPGLVRLGRLLLSGQGQPLAPLLRALADTIESENTK